MNQQEIYALHSHPAMQEYHAIVKQIEAGYPMHPREVQDVVDALLEEGFHFQAERLGRMKINWDR
ncbi:hypothetical protein [Sphingobium sp. HDIP04]|uniref:hypothetical protein n=1 Tax=Sphingobium sp. HDIP04 TaxID=428994 RepID=UPI0003877902|nr:hypothetical protein [Sphingobium sp. HDIP04]EQB03932.1 hypothetical protein L286_11255 [Sphingobium sp. HDIP04]